MVTSLAGVAACSVLAALSCTPSPGGDEPAMGPAQGGGAGRAPANRGDGLVVHEWGTFTSLQGSDGASLDGLQHETEAVPAFVHTNVRAEPSPFAVFGDASRDVPAVRGVRSKMETPVIYFYSAAERRVSVEVDFVGGLLTHWYPRYAAASPEIAPRAAGAEPVDMRELSRSTLRWEIDLTPSGQPAPSEIPEVPAEDAWQFARETKAATLRTAPPREGAQSSATEADHYIFYRGLGRLQLPLQVVSVPGGVTIVANDGDVPIGAAILLEMRQDQGRFQVLPELAPQGSCAVPVSSLPMRSKAELMPALEKQVLTALTERGLFEDEARAMVRTWSRAWFASEGTRVLYVVPRQVTDRVLPLRIDPTPDDLVRVLVGRHEYLTPEVEAEVEALLRERVSADPRKVRAAMERLGRMGRFLEPAVRRAMQRTADEAVRRSARQVLAAFG
jgi:hypothetical protein